MTNNVFEIQVKPQYTLVRFIGFVDAASVERMRPLLQSQIPAQSKNIIIDLQAVTFLDSHGVGLFVSLLKQAHKNGGKVYLAGSTGQPASVLRMVGFNGSLVTYCEDVNDVYAELEKKAV
jgi:anti-anti-sigma factor